MADLSGAVTTGGVAQVAAAADANRSSLIIQNSSDTNFWVAFGATAVADSPSILVLAGLTTGTVMVFGPEWREMITKAISVFGATTGKKFTMFDTKG